MKKLILIIFLLTSFAGYSNDSTNIKKLTERVELLETYNNEITDKKIDANILSLNNSIDFEIKKAKEELKDQLWLFTIVVGVIGVVVAAGVIAFIYQYFIGIKKIAEKVLKQKLGNYLQENTDYIYELITSQRTENKIKAEKKIKVVCGNEEELNSTKKKLESMGFKNVSGLVTSDYVQVEDTDLIIFSNPHNSMRGQMVTKYLDNSGDNDVFIYFGRNLEIDRNNAAYMEKINFANSQFTLYHQIINTLVFKDLIK